MGQNLLRYIIVCFIFFIIPSFAQGASDNDLNVQEDKKIEVQQYDSDRILSQSTRKINAIYPQDLENATNNFPGYRGANQLVIYTGAFGKTTQTNEFGKEAIVIDNIVVELTGANTTIPKNGYVVSGHGAAKKWINDNLKIGTKIEITEDIIKAYTTVDSYRYCAKRKIEEVQKILISTKNENKIRNEKEVYSYYKKAKQQYKKSLKSSSDEAVECAKEAIKNANMVYRYTIPYIANELKGTWVRPKEKNEEEIKQTLDKIKSAGINNVFLETYFHGNTIFPSSVMENYGFTKQNPIFVGFDPLEIWVKEAHNRGIKIHVWFESFYVGNKSPENNPTSILSVKPNWMNKPKQKADFPGYISHPQEHNGYFLDPANSEVIEFLTKLINEIVSKYNVDGVNIDYVRYPNISKENYNNQWGYTPYAREEFQRTYGIDPIDIQPNSDFWEEWCIYRRNKVTDYIKKVSKLVKNKNVTFSAVIFPDYQISVRTKYQDWAFWMQEKYLDAATPLILTGDDKLAVSMLEEIKKISQNNSKIYPGLFAGFIESDPEDLLKQINIVRKLKLDGIILFDWAHLNDNYIEVLKASAFNPREY